MGRYLLQNLSKPEYDAALVAVKQVRSNEIENAFYEGMYCGIEIQSRLYRGEKPLAMQECWENSHAKFLKEQQS